jgi:hypothetical protein
VKRGLIVFILILAVAIFYLSTLRTGHPPGDDFAMYIHHAKNIAEGKPYQQTGYIYDRRNPGVGPPEYPPMFPLLLAGVYKIAGMDLTSMKILNILLFLAALYVFYLAFGNDLPFWHIVAVLAVLALNPYYWGAKDEILSDTLFLLLCYLGLWVFASGAGRWRIVVTTLCIYLAFATRTAGVVLIPVLIATDLVQSRRVRLATLATVLIASTLILAHLNFFDGAASYTKEVQVRSMAHGAGAHSSNGGVKAWSYVRGVVGFSQALMYEIENRLWHSDVSSHLTQLFCVTAVLLGLAGYVLRLLGRPNVFDVFALGYVAMIILWRAADVRLLSPIIPLWILYAATALEAMRRRSGGRAVANGVVLLTLSQVGLAYGSVYAHAQYGTIRTGIADADFIELSRYIERETPRSAVLIYSSPRLLALTTDRSASAYHRTEQDSELWEYFRSISATYVIYSPEIAGDRAYLAGFLARSRNQLREVFANRKFVLYQIAPANQLSGAVVIAPDFLQASIRQIDSCRQFSRKPALARSNGDIYSHCLARSA